MTKRDRLSSIALPAHLPALLLLAIAVVPLGIARAEAQDVAPAAAADSSSGPGMKVNVDPKTGRFLEEPAAESGAASKRAAAAPIVMEPSPVEGGGVGFHVDDQRFDSEMKATVSPDGKADIACDAPAK